MTEPDWPTVEKFWAWALRISFELNATISCGPRSVARNRAVGGHPQSRHLWESGWGCAVDYVFDSHAEREEARARANAAGYSPYVGPDYGPFRLHIQAFAKGAPLRSLVDAADHPPR